MTWNFNNKGKEHIRKEGQREIPKLLSEIPQANVNTGKYLR